MEDSIFILSNGCTNIYNENTLSSFQNDLPRIFTLDGRYKFEVALKKIGFSSDFRLIKIENNTISFIVCKMKLRPAVRKRSESDMITFINEHVEKYWAFEFKDKHYSVEELQRWFAEVQTTCENIPKIKFIYNRIFFDHNPSQPYCVLFSEDFMKSFGIFKKSVIDELPSMLNFHSLTEKDFMIHRLKLQEAPLEFFYDGGKKDYFGIHSMHKKKTLQEQKFKFNDTIYYGYFIINSVSTIHGVHDMSKKHYPKLIKVKCQNINAQIFNNTQSKDLAIFTPKFDLKDEKAFYFHEFENLEYCIIQNSILKSLSFKLTDEEDNQLDLHPGTPTILQLKFRRMPLIDETMNIRISSSKSELFPDNKNNSFRVKLANSLYLNKDWKVALTSINYPTYFSTFPADEKLRTITYNGAGVRHDETLFTEKNITFPFNIPYSKQEIVSMFNNLMKVQNLGFVDYQSERLKITFKKLYNAQRIFFPNQLLDMLGYDGRKDDGDVTKFLLTEENHEEMCITYFPSTKYEVLTFNKPINVRYFHPQYLMIYANFIGSTIISDTYQKVLKIVSVDYLTTDHVIKEFKSKDYCDLQNTEIKDIEIEIRGHDGNLINFIDTSDIIMNLEFTNNID